MNVNMFLAGAGLAALAATAQMVPEVCNEGFVSVLMLPKESYSYLWTIFPWLSVKAVMLPRPSAW